MNQEKANGTLVPTPIEIEFLYLDLATCERCLATDEQLEAALERIHDVLNPDTVQLEVRKTLVESADQARALRFASSPTIRVSGRDIAGELVESECEADACSCGGSTACRVWRHGGREYNHAPTELIVEAVLAEVERGGAPRQADGEPFVLPENLVHHFARREAAAQASSCYAPEQQASCCDPGEKEVCCGEGSATEGCGCR